MTYLCRSRVKKSSPWCSACHVFGRSPRIWTLARYLELDSFAYLPSHANRPSPLPQTHPVLKAIVISLYSVIVCPHSVTSSPSWQSRTSVTTAEMLDMAKELIPMDISIAGCALIRLVSTQPPYFGGQYQQQAIHEIFVAGSPTWKSEQSRLLHQCRTTSATLPLSSTFRSIYSGKI